jgi:hypothetical protein
MLNALPRSFRAERHLALLDSRRAWERAGRRKEISTAMMAIDEQFHQREAALAGNGQATANRIGCDIETPELKKTHQRVQFPRHDTV